MDLAVTPAIDCDMQGMDGNTPVTGLVISGRTTVGGSALAGNLEVAVIRNGFVGGGYL